MPFTNRDIAEDETAMKELQEKVPGAMSTPVILVDDEVIMGFDRTKLQKALGLQ